MSDNEGIPEDNELFASKPKPKRMFAYNWAQGFLSPFIPTPTRLLDALFCRVHCTTADVVVDLGCGDGRVIVSAVRATGCRGIGVDLDASLIEKAKESSRVEVCRLCA